MFDNDKADRAVNFITCLKHTKGKWRGVPFELLPWQDEIVRTLFGTVKENGYQSRMNGYSVGRQNGWLSANDIREMENLNPISDEEGGNLYLVNGSMTKLADAGAFAKTDTIGSDETEELVENNGRRDKR